MLQMEKTIILKNIEEIKVPYEFLTDSNCVKVLNSALLDLTWNQFCWNDIKDGLLWHKQKFGNDQKVGTYVLWVDYEKQALKISIFKVSWFYYLK